MHRKMGNTKRLLFQPQIRILKTLNILFIIIPYLAFSQNNNLQSKKQFQSVINENKGKVIYLEFWASWCAPCIKELKKTKKLQSKYKGEDITFVYLSIDTDKQSWVKSSKKLEIFDYNYNLLTQDFHLSKNLKSLEVTSIPYYIIIDKNGKISEVNAPNPNSKDIIKRLDFYLNQ